MSAAEGRPPTPRVSRRAAAGNSDLVGRLVVNRADRGSDRSKVEDVEGGGEVSHHVGFLGEEALISGGRLQLLQSEDCTWGGNLDHFHYYLLENVCMRIRQRPQWLVGYWGR